MADMFADRIEAGRRLADKLRSFHGRTDVIVLALPRGGVPVADVVARELQAPLDVLIVRKVGLPSNPELAMGAVASGGVEVVNQSVTRSWGIGPEQFKEVARREVAEMERRQSLYRKGRGPLKVEGKVVLLVDDGIATGSTVKAAVTALRKRDAKSVVVAVPVAALDTVESLRSLADDVVVVYTPSVFFAVGAHYQDFSQTSDEEVIHLLDAAHNRQQRAE